MNSIKILICFTTLLFIYSQSAPAPGYINLTDLLSVAGPFSTFLKYLESTKVIETLQNQANTEEGLTLFIPRDKSFTDLKKPSLSNLTSDQLKQLCLFHALPHFYWFSDFENLSGARPINTFAGGSYTLDFTSVTGTMHIGTGWTNTLISSTVHSTDPVAIYQVNNVLLPEAIFGTDIPPPVVDTPAADGGKGKAAKASSPSGSNKVVGWSLWRRLMIYSRSIDEYISI